MVERPIPASATDMRFIKELVLEKFSSQESF